MNPIWSLAASVAAELADHADAHPDARSRRSAKSVAHCLKAVKAWAAHPDVAFDDAAENALHWQWVEDRARMAVMNAVVAADSGELVRVGVPTDAGRPTRRAGDWREFRMRLKHFRTLKRSELNAASCHAHPLTFFSSPPSGPVEPPVRSVRQRPGDLEHPRPDLLEIHQVGRAAKQRSTFLGAAPVRVQMADIAAGQELARPPGRPRYGPQLPGQDRHRRSSAAFTVTKRFSFRPSLMLGAPTGLPYLAS